MPVEKPLHEASNVAGVRSSFSDDGSRTSPTESMIRAVQIAVMLDDDAHPVLTHTARWQTEPHTQIDRGYDTAAQVQRTGDRGWRQRDRGNFLRRQHVRTWRTGMPQSCPPIVKVTN